MKALTLVVVLAIAACGDDDPTTPIDAAVPVDVPGDAMPREVVMENVPLAVTEIVEAKLLGGPPSYARIEMMAGGLPLDWNLHAHPNGQTEVVKEELGVTSVDFLFVPSAAADWFLLLRNRGQTDITIELRVELYGDMQWTGFL